MSSEREKGKGEDESDTRWTRGSGGAEGKGGEGKVANGTAGGWDKPRRRSKVD
jgi:hypothetical protein